MPDDTKALAIGHAVLGLLDALGIGAAPENDSLVLLEQVPSLFPGVTKSLAYDAARVGKLAAVKIGRKPAARRSAIEAWLSARKVSPRARKAPTAIPADAGAAYLALVNGGGR